MDGLRTTFGEKVKNMKSKMQVLLGLASATLLTQASQANPITGAIDFTGSATLNNSLGLATAVDSFSHVMVQYGTQTGAFVGTDGDAATMTPFTWAPTPSVNVDPLWTFTDATTGYTYSFDLSSLMVKSQDASFLNIDGSGMLTITGKGSPYTETPGQWTFTISQSGPKDSFTFGFDSETTSVPDGGATVALLGSAMVGLSVLRKKMGA